MRRQNRKSEAGFSLLELMVVVAILVVVMGAVFTQIDTVQKRYSQEEQRVDITQQSREFFDQVARDLHQVGYPNIKMFQLTALGNPPQNDSRVAVGFVRYGFDEVWFEGDVDGDGAVDVVRYLLQPDAVTGMCPCRLSRSVSLKINGTAPTAQQVAFFNTDVSEIVNSGGAQNTASGVARYQISGQSAVGGSLQSNDALYTVYKNANVFTAFDGDGVMVAPSNNPAVLRTIRTIRVNLNLLTPRADAQTGMRPAVTMSASVRIPANMN